MKTPESTLFINDLKLSVYLGWPDTERLKKQTILINISIDFFKAPKACKSDNLNDTFCYDDLIKTIKKEISNKKFRLIEHLSFEIYQIIKQVLPKQTKLNVGVTKYPKIVGLDSLSFHYKK